MSLLGIDIGTTGCKACAFSVDGRAIHPAYREYPTLYPGPGLAELDSNRVWGDVKSCITEVAKQTKHDPVTALCVSAMGEAAVPVSAGRRILGNSILSMDTRGKEYVRQLQEKITPEQFFAINPNSLSASYTMPKILWTRDNLPDVYAQTGLFMLWDGVVAYLLGCDPFVSFSHANRTLLFDIRKETWSDELIQLSGVDPRRLPCCLAGGTVAGTIPESSAAELGLPKGVKVVVGGHDQCCGALGAGIIHGGKAVDGIGTFECITPVYDRIPEASPMLGLGLNVEHHVLPGLYVSFIFNQAGSLVRWFRDTFAQDLAGCRDAFDRLAAEMPPEPTSLLVLPYFETTGAPGYVSDASGVIAGLRTSTKRGEILKAIMECSSFWFAQSIRSLGRIGIDTSEFVATGGGAKSDAWLQIKADIFGVPIVRPLVTECGLAGAAMLAGLGTGAYSSAQEAVGAFVRYGRRFDPDAGRHARYAERIAAYDRFFKLVHPFLAGTGV